MPLGVGRDQNVELIDFCHILTLLPPIASMFHKQIVNLLICIFKAESWKSENTESLGGLWLGMLKYFCLTFEHQNNIVSIRQSMLSRTERKWNNKRLAVEGEWNRIG